MPRYQYVQIGFTPETLAKLDAMEDDRSKIVRRAVEAMLDE